MEYLIGVISAVIIALTGKFTKFEKDSSFYPTVLIVIAFLYVLFAVLDGRREVIIVEIVFALVFSLIALIGFKKSELLVGAGIAAHGLFDFFHHLLVNDAGVPGFWPGFCLSIDLLLGLYIVIIKRKFKV